MRHREFAPPPLDKSFVGTNHKAKRPLLCLQTCRKIFLRMPPSFINDRVSPLMRLRMRIADIRGRGLYAGYPNRHRCIFIHVPKTAGTAIARALFESPSEHIPYFIYQRTNPAKFHRFFKFAFVRNPWDRLVSSFFYLHRGGMHAYDQAWSERFIAPYRGDFGQFVRNWLTSENVSTWAHFAPQSDFILDARDNVMVDFVGRYERLHDDFQFVARRLKLNTALRPINESAHDDFRRCYDEETSSIVQKVYARDIKVFGYSPPVAGIIPVR